MLTYYHIYIIIFGICGTVLPYKLTQSSGPGLSIFERLWNAWFSLSKDEQLKPPSPAELPRPSAFFWGPWSAWPLCPSLLPCPNGPRLRIERKRVCQRLQYAYSPRSGIVSVDGKKKTLIPCFELDAVDTEYDYCQDCKQTSSKPMDEGTTVTPLKPETQTSTVSVATTTTTTLETNATVKWHKMRGCQSLMLEVDDLPDGFPWEILWNYVGRPEGQKCEPGLAFEMRVCSPDATSCEMNSTPDQFSYEYLTDSVREVHCWIDQQCPQSTQPPMGCSFRAVLNEPVINITWNRTPFSLKPLGYQIHILRSEDETPTIYEVLLKEELDPWGERYSIELGNVSLGMKYITRVGTTDSEGRFVTSPDCSSEVVVGAGDGGWSSWSWWSDCSSQCSVHPGTRTRQRWCNSPSPTNNGRSCVGPATMTQQCYGTQSPCAKHA